MAQVIKHIHHSSQGKIERPEAENSKYIRCIDNKSILRNCENSRYRVDSKKQIRRFDDDNNDKKQRGIVFSIDTDEKFLLVETGSHGK